MTYCPEPGCYHQRDHEPPHEHFTRRDWMQVIVTDLVVVGVAFTLFLLAMTQTRG